MSSVTPHAECSMRHARVARLQPLWLLVGAWLAGCGAPSFVSARPTFRVHEHELHCARATMGKNSPYRMPLAPPVEDPADMARLDVLPPEARHAARAGGLEPLLAELLREPASLDGEARTSRVERRQALMLRLVALETQVSAVAFETSCTRQRISDLLRALDRREGDRQLSLAAASLIVGAITGTVAGVWDLTARRPSNLPTIIGITGGVATAGLGSAALLQPMRTVVLEHAHNLLRPMADGLDPEHLYPSFVFRMLTVQYPGDLTTARAGLLVDFASQLDEVPSWDRARVELTLFGAGGLYDVGLLARREELLRALESAVQGVARDLELLMRSLVRVLAQ